jgi:hypothetical protein
MAGMHGEVPVGDTRLGNIRISSLSLSPSELIRTTHVYMGSLDVTPF